MRVFISHSSKDKVVTAELAAELKNRGFEVWYDNWELLAGDNIVAKINQGLDTCEAGIIVFSVDSKDSRWVDAEISYLTYARIQEGKILIPVMVDERAYVPPLLRPLLRAVMDFDAIAAALRNRPAIPAHPTTAARRNVERVLISLCKSPAGAPNSTIDTEVKLNGQLIGKQTHAEIPKRLALAHQSFLEGTRAGLRSPAVVPGLLLQSTLAELGHELRAFCLPGDSDAALRDLLDAVCKLGVTAEICFEANAPDLLALPFEALRLSDDRVLALQPAAVLMRRPSGLTHRNQGPLAGPVKILIAVGAPDEKYSSGPVLDLERELQVILDAVEPANRLDNVQVRILEVGSPDAIADAFREEEYHVLHISCHGVPGKLALENEELHEVPTTARELIDPLRNAGKPLPMVVLNTCHGGVQKGQAASFAEELLRAGVQSVLAMQTSVTDVYATDLVREFYENLGKGDFLLPSRALADARKCVEEERLKRIQAHPAAAHPDPEYATASLFVAGEEQKLADFNAAPVPLRHTPRYVITGVLPQLSLGYLIGRRQELRNVLKALRDTSGQYAGVVLTGIGGIGKSAIAGRAIQRMAESKRMIAQHKGRFELSQIAQSLARVLKLSKTEEHRELARQLSDPGLEEWRALLIGQALTETPVILVLDDFEQNLTIGGGQFQNPTTADYMEALASACKVGRLLITCRYPIPGLDYFFCRVPVGALSPAENRKLLLRLEGLKDVDSKILQKVAGHPRMLELLEAIANNEQGRFPHITQKLRELQAKRGNGPAALSGEQKEAFDLALLLGARDIFLDELLDIVRVEGLEEHLLQTAVSNLPVSAAGLARMLDETGGNPAAARKTLTRLRDLSLVYLNENDSASVHRWTAEGLRRLTGDGRWQELADRAGRYRWWQVVNESHDLGDAVEAVRNWLTGRKFDEAVSTATACFESLQGSRRTFALDLASEILETLPETHSDYSLIADEEAQAHLALGFTDRALERYTALMRRHERLAQTEPNRADFQRDLSVSYNKVGDLYRGLGQGDLARDNFLLALEIRKRLAQAEPNRADFQRDLSVSYNKVGDLYRDLGQGDLARDNFLLALEIAKRLAEAEPNRADFQRDLSVSYNKLGDLYRDLGQGDLARDNFLLSLEIRKRLAQAEPNRADFQRDLSVSYNKVGDLYRGLGQGDLARDYFLLSLEIAQTPGKAEPNRADFQRDLSVSYEKVGDLYRDLGQGDLARDSFLLSLEIRKRLARPSPTAPISSATSPSPTSN